MSQDSSGGCFAALLVIGFAYFIVSTVSAMVVDLLDSLASAIPMILVLGLGGGVLCLTFLAFVAIYRRVESSKRRKRVEAEQRESILVKQRADAERAINEQREQAARAMATKQVATAAYNGIAGLVARDCLILDSNAWMQEEYSSLFKALIIVMKQLNRKFFVCREQFDEIYKIREESKYGSIKNQKARMAMSRLEQFQECDLLDLQQISLYPRMRTHADNALLNTLRENVAAGRSIAMITDDRPLRMVARQHVPVRAKHRVAINSVSEVNKLCEQFLKDTSVLPPTVSRPTHARNNGNDSSGLPSAISEPTKKRHASQAQAAVVQLKYANANGHGARTTSKHTSLTATKSQTRLANYCACVIIQRGRKGSIVCCWCGLPRRRSFNRGTR